MSFRDECLDDLPVNGWMFADAGTVVSSEVAAGAEGTLHHTVTKQLGSRTGQAGDYSVDFPEFPGDGCFSVNMPIEIEDPGTVHGLTVELIVKMEPKANAGLPDKQARMWHLQPRDTLWYSTSNTGAGAGLFAWENHYLRLWFITSAGGKTLNYFDVPSSTFEIFDGEWHHLVCVLDTQGAGGGTTTDALIYVDGQLVGSQTGFVYALKMLGDDSFGFPNPSKFYIGASCSIGTNAPSALHDGMAVDEAWLYDTPLSAARVLAHYNELPQIDPVSLDLPIEMAINAAPEDPVDNSVYLAIQILIAEDVTLDLPIDLASNRVELDLPIHLQPFTDVTLDLPIELERNDTATPNRVSGKWRVSVSIGGVDYSSKLTGAVEMEQEENASGLFEFDLIMDGGVIDQSALIGSDVVLRFTDISTADIDLLTVTRIKGKVSDPRWDPETRIMRVHCTTDLQGAMDKSSRTQIDGLTPAAKWSPIVFEEGAQGYAYFEDRMRTVQQAAWHSPTGVKLTDWAAKPSADFTFTDDEVFEVYEYRPANSRQLTNQVDISFDYRYKRKRQRTLSVRWVTEQLWCEYLQHGYNLCQRAMVEQAANDTAWVMQGQVNFTPTPDSGVYSCPKTGAPGNFDIVYVNQLYADRFAVGANWLVARRWAQNMTERYTIKIHAPQSQAGNGILGSHESYSLESEDDLTAYLTAEDYDASDAIASSGFEGVGGNVSVGGFLLGDSAGDATENQDTGRVAADLGREVMILAGVADLLQAHRQNAQSFLVPFQPSLNLTHTVMLNADGVQAMGKVARIRDRLDIDTGDATTEVTLALSRHEGTGLIETSPLEPSEPPPKPSEAEADIPTTLWCRTHIGGLKASPQLTGNESGYFTNWTYDFTDNDPFADNPNEPDTVVYAEQFKVRYPEIEGTAIEAQEVPATQVVAVEIPNDLLVLTQ